MQIIYGDYFKKRFQKIPLKIQKEFEERLNLFIESSSHPLLKVHPLTGNLVGFRAFSVTGNYRVVYKILNTGSIKLVDIGTHPQVYG